MEPLQLFGKFKMMRISGFPAVEQLPPTKKLQQNMIAEIRRRSRLQYMQNIRDSMQFNSLQSLGSVLAQWQFPPTANSQQPDLQVLIKIVESNQKQLLNPSALHEMEHKHKNNDPTSNYTNQTEFQQQLTTLHSSQTQKHEELWRCISQCLHMEAQAAQAYSQKRKGENLNGHKGRTLLVRQNLKQPLLSLENFIKQFIILNKYEQNGSQPLKDVIMESLWLLRFNRKQMDNKHNNGAYEYGLLKWVSGKAENMNRNLKFVDAILDSIQALESSRTKFINVEEFPNIYNLVNEALINTKGLDGTADLCSKILVKLLVHGDYNEIYQIHQKHTAIVTSLISAASEAVSRNDQILSQQLQVCLCYLLDTYDCVVFQYVEMGLMYLVYQYLCPSCGSDGVIQSGLSILVRLAAIKRTTNNGLSILSVLLAKVIPKPRSAKKTESNVSTQTEQSSCLDSYCSSTQSWEQTLWGRICGNNSLLEHPNITIRKDAFSVLQILTAVADVEEAHAISQMFDGGIVSYIAGLLRHEDEELAEEADVVWSCLSILGNYLHLALNIDDEDDSPFLQHCEEMGIDKTVKQLKFHGNVRIGSKAHKIEAMLGQ